MQSPDTSSDTISPELNRLDSSADRLDLEGLALLRQIFPEESTEELYKLHQQQLLLRSIERCQTNVENDRGKTSPSSNLGKRIWKEFKYLKQQCATNEESNNEAPLYWQEKLPGDFLRLPADLAVRRQNAISGKWEYQLIEDLQRRTIEQYRRYTGDKSADDNFYTKVLWREPKDGLGITLVDEYSRVRIHAASQRHRRDSSNLEEDFIMLGDIVIGVNGYALFEISSRHHSVLRQTVAMIKSSPSPIVLHLQRASRQSDKSLQAPAKLSLDSTPALLDTTVHEVVQLSTSSGEPTHSLHPPLHSFAQTLSSRGLLKRPTDQIVISDTIFQCTERARQFEFSNSFRIDASTFKLLPNFDEPLDSLYSHHYDEDKKDVAPSTPLRGEGAIHVDSSNTSVLSNHLRDSDGFDSLSEISSPSRSPYPASEGNTPDRTRSGNNSDIFIPLMGVRKALCVRILNTFLDGNYVAYTIFVRDVESGVEFYAPLRYFADFQDLRSATVRLNPRIRQIPFPSQGWSFFGYSEANDSEALRDSKCRQLENFLRILCAEIYIGPLHPNIAMVAIHLQSFLGIDNVSMLQSRSHLAQHACHENNTHYSSFHADSAGEFRHSNEQRRLRALLKRSLQMYVYRIFLLEPMRDIVARFVDAARASGPGLKEIENMQAQGQSVLKRRAMEELRKIQAVIDQLQDLMLEGCMNDMRSVSRHDEFLPLHPFLAGREGDVYWDRLVREAVREQIEVEVYLPLRSSTSRLLVNAWRHDDMAVSFKIQELKKRPQEFFRIPEDKQSHSEWRSVSRLLEEVQSSTLPSAKLRAIVEAASEISRLYKHEHPAIGTAGAMGADDQEMHLGADDFLPIFIFCVIRAEMERPCALCVLLRTFCDPINRMGEVGYYLASFEAAVTHIKEIDLSQSHEEMFSFLSIPLSDTSFG